MCTSSSEGSIAQSCAGSWNVAGSNIRRSKLPAASGHVVIQDLRNLVTFRKQYKPKVMIKDITLI